MSTRRTLQPAKGLRPRLAAQPASETPPEELLQVRAVHDGHSLSLASIPNAGRKHRQGRPRHPNGRMQRLT